MSAAEQMVAEDEVLDFGENGEERGDDTAAGEPLENIGGEEQGDEQMLAATAADGENPEDLAAHEEQATVLAEHEAQQHEAPPEETDTFDPLKMPPHGTEVFISRIPRGASDAQLKEFCEQCGEIYNIRIPKDPGNAGQNKGYAFAVYKTKENADNALTKLSQMELKDFPGQKVAVTVSQVKNRLFIGNIPKELTKEALMTELSSEVKGIEGIELMLDRDTNQNRGFGFVEFYNHSCAEGARRKLGRPDFRLSERPITVLWAEPREPRNNEAELEKVKAIYVGALPDNVEERQLRQIYSAYGEIEQVVIPRNKENPEKNRDYCFIHFKERASALKAVEDAETAKHELDGKPVLVHMARPQPERPFFPGGYGGYGAGYQSYGYGRGRGAYGPPGRGMQSGAYVRGATSYAGVPGRGRGPPVGRGMAYGGRGRSAAMYAPASAYGQYEEDWGEEWGEDYGEYEDYGDYADYGSYSSGSALIPMMLPSGQMGYVLSGQSASRSRPAAAASYARPSYRAPASAYGGAATYSSGASVYRAGSYAAASGARVAPRTGAVRSASAYGGATAYAPRSSGSYANGATGSYSSAGGYAERRPAAGTANPRYRPY